MIYQPKIIVKKSDGTQVRMTMDEFKEYKKHFSTSAQEQPAQGWSASGGKNTETPGMEIEEDEEQVHESTSLQVDKPVVEKKVVEKNETELQFSTPQTSAETSKKEVGKLAINSEQSRPQKRIAKSRREDLPMKNEHHELARTTPVKNIFIDEAIASRQVGKSTSHQVEEKKVWTKEDHQSPLEDEVEELKEHKSLEVLPDKKQDLFSEVLKKIKFPISDDLQARLHSLITSRIKEVRTDEQFLSYIGRPVDSGGMGLGDVESQELLQIVKDVWHIVDQRRSKQLETIKKPVSPTDKIPVEDGKEALVKRQVTKLNVALPRKNTERKPILHDIVKPKEIVQSNKSASLESEKRSVGPVEEIKNFSLVELRRMGDKPSDNFKKLLEKFKVLKKESIVLYFQALQVWNQSPLYKQYQDLIFQAVDSGSKLKDISVGGETLTWEEVKELVVFMNKLT